MLFLSLLTLEVIFSFQTPEGNCNMWLLKIFRVTRVGQKNYPIMYFPINWMKISWQRNPPKDRHPEVEKSVHKAFWLVPCELFSEKSIRKKSSQIKNSTFSLWIIFMHTETCKYQRTMQSMQPKYFVVIPWHILEQSEQESGLCSNQIILHKTQWDKPLHWAPCSTEARCYLVLCIVDA